LGEYSRVEQSFEDIKLAYEYNKKSILEVLEFCRSRGAKLIYAGSSTKFGDDGMARDASPYAWMKATNTELVVNYDSWFALPHAITYFYNVYGPREISTGSYATLIGIFREKMRRSESLGVALPGVQQRNFTHVADIVDGLIEIGRYGHGDGYGVGSDDAFSIFEVAKMFGGEIEILPERPGNRMSGTVCSERTKSLGWAPKRSLADYILTLRRNDWSY
jgi:UDP-glucose 4-epimerase